MKKVLSLFGSGREEDRMVGYLSFLKIGPKLLKFLPGMPFPGSGSSCQSNCLEITPPCPAQLPRDHKLCFARHPVRAAICQVCPLHFSAGML